jgi:hypothetical protein
MLGNLPEDQWPKTAFSSIQAMCMAQLRTAMEGGKTGAAAAKEITDRLQGRPRQTLEIEGPLVDVGKMSPEELEQRVIQMRRARQALEEGKK